MRDHSPCDSSTKSLGFLLVDAARLLRRRFEQESRDMAMTGSQMQVIARLSKNEGIGQSALASLLDLEPMTLCRHIDRMTAAGLVERRQDPEDRRARQVFTTEKGRELLAPMRKRAETVFEQAQQGLSPQAREDLLESLQVVISNLSAAEAGKSEEEAVSRSAGRVGEIA